MIKTAHSMVKSLMFPCPFKVYGFFNLKNDEIKSYSFCYFAYALHHEIDRALVVPNWLFSSPHNVTKINTDGVFTLVICKGTTIGYLTFFLFVLVFTLEVAFYYFSRFEIFLVGFWH